MQFIKKQVFYNNNCDLNKAIALILMNILNIKGNSLNFFKYVNNIKRKFKKIIIEHYISKQYKIIKKIASLIKCKLF